MLEPSGAVRFRMEYAGDFNRCTSQPVCARPTARAETESPRQQPWHAVFFHFMLLGNRFTSFWFTKLNSSALYLFFWPLRLNTKIRVFVRSSRRASLHPLLYTPTLCKSLLARTAGLSVTAERGWSSAALGCLVLHLPINARHKQSRQAL